MAGTSDEPADPWAVTAAAFPDDGTTEEQATFLLRYAVLAPSSHNSQPWTFAVDGRTVAVDADASRWLTEADPDGRELHLSVGCALENLVVAAEHFGFGVAVEYLPDGVTELDADRSPEEASPRAATVTLDPDGAPADGPAVPLDAITERRTSHGVFADRPLPDETVARLAAAVGGPDERADATGGTDAATTVRLELVEDPEVRARIAALQTRADEHQFADPAYRRELGHWIGTGALGANWLLARVGQLAVTHLDLGDREGRKNSRLLESAPVVGVFVTDRDGPESWLRTGRAFERLALRATAEGVAVHPLSQTLEVPAFRSALADLLDLADGHPQHLVRLGAATDAEAHTPRRPLSAVLRS